MYDVLDRFQDTAISPVADSRPIARREPPETNEPLTSRQGRAASTVSRDTVIWGLPLAALTHAETVDRIDGLIRRGKPSFFITANLHYAMLSRANPDLRRVNRQAAFLVADGMPMVWYARLIQRRIPERVAGADLIWSLCALAADRGYRVFLLGGAQGVAEEAAKRLCEHYPGLEIAGTAAPNLGRLSAGEHRELIARIQQSQSQLLFAALGQPKGELWLAEHCEALGVPACVQIGASPDFVAGRARRAPVYWQRLGLEWLYRTWREPRRLLPRYLANGRFLVRCVSRDLLAVLLKRRAWR